MRTLLKQKLPNSFSLFSKRRLASIIGAASVAAYYYQEEINMALVMRSKAAFDHHVKNYVALKRMIEKYPDNSQALLEKSGIFQSDEAFEKFITTIDAFLYLLGNFSEQKSRSFLHNQEFSLIKRNFKNLYPILAA